MGAERSEYAEAEAMIDTFVSVGATRFDLTWTNAAGAKERFRGNLNLTDLCRALPAMLDTAPAKKRNIIVRPHGPGVTFIQLDDLKADQLIPLAPVAFLSISTSPGNYQAWVALASAEDKDFARRLRKGASADASASGATRLAGSINFKNKYAPHFPHVTIHAAHPGRLTTIAELERLGLVAAPEIVAQPLRIAPARVSPGSNRKWPSYARCLEGAPQSQSIEGQPRQSIADFTWCLIAASWGWQTEEIAERLFEESAATVESDMRELYIDHRLGSPGGRGPAINPRNLLWRYKVRWLRQMLSTALSSNN
jgi:hypothetical protein